MTSELTSTIITLLSEIIGLGFTAGMLMGITLFGVITLLNAALNIFKITLTERSAEL